MQFCLPQYERKIEAHWQKWENCRNCALNESRRKVVLWRGYIPCDILFVGEAPGINEDRLGYPFVGEAGNLLELILSEALNEIRKDHPSFNEPRICITNIVCCMPITKSYNKIREPEKDEIAACSPRLQELISIAEPKVIVTIGKLAKAAVKLSIPIHEIEHPASLLRMEATNFVPAYCIAITDTMEALRDAI